eukprot:4653059-Amphidinium_carterae.1
MACRAFITPLQSLTTLRGWHSSKARTTAKSSALKTDCRQPGRASEDLSPVHGLGGHPAAAPVKDHAGARTPGPLARKSASQTHDVPCSSGDSGEQCAQGSPQLHHT